MGGFGPQVHIDKALTNHATRYIQDEKSFVADRIMPPLKVAKESDKYFKFGRDDWSLRDAKRAPSAISNRTKMPTLTTPSYMIEEYSVHDYISKREIEEADTPLAPLQDAAESIMEQIMVLKDNSVGGLLALTASVANSLSQPAASKWDYTSTTTPLTDTDVARQTVLKASGRMPNIAVCGPAVFRILKNHADILDRIKYTQKGLLTEQLLASCMDLDDFVVGRSIKQVGPETATGADSETMNFIWGSNISYLYRTARPNIKNANFGYQFTKRSGNIQIKKWYDKDRDAWKVEGSSFWDAHVTSSLSGYTYFSVVAAT